MDDDKRSSVWSELFCGRGLEFRDAANFFFKKAATVSS